MRKLLPLIAMLLAFGNGVERFSILISSMGAAAIGTYFVGWLIENLFPNFHARATGLEAIEAAPEPEPEKLETGQSVVPLG